MLDEVSIQRQLQREARFEPLCCPRSSCPNHLPEQARQAFWRKDGCSKLKRFPYASQRFQCKDCSKKFSASLFQLHYRQKVWGLNATIFGYFKEGASKRAIASPKRPRSTQFTAGKNFKPCETSQS